MEFLNPAIVDKLDGLVVAMIIILVMIFKNNDVKKLAEAFNKNIDKLAEVFEKSQENQSKNIEKSLEKQGSYIEKNTEILRNVCSNQDKMSMRLEIVEKNFECKGNSNVSSCSSDLNV